MMIGSMLVMCMVFDSGFSSPFRATGALRGVAQAPH
jgi:hypothetical protein